MGPTNAHPSDPSNHSVSDRDNAPSSLGLRADPQAPTQTVTHSTASEVEDLKERLGKMVETLQASYRDRRDAWGKIKQLQQVVTEAGDKEHRAAMREIKLQEENTRLQAALSSAQNAQRTAVTLLETRAGELKAAQAYLTKVDDVPDSEVLQLVHNLNASIYQTAATIADTYRTRFSRYVNNVQDHYTLLDWIPEPLFLRLVSNFDHTQNPVLVQTALNVLMTRFMDMVCTPCKLESNTAEVIIQQLYSQIRDHEPQSVSGRWRALSLTFLRKGSVEEHESGVSWLRTQLLEIVFKVLDACGMAEARRSVYNLQKEMAKTFNDVICLALRLRRLVGEQIVSRDLIPLLVMHNDSFDPALMEDEWIDPRKPVLDTDRQPVLCTMGIGLCREEGVPSASGIQVRRTVLLKAKVIRTSMLDEIK